MSFRSFKRPRVEDRPRLRTPSPPRDAVEPLTPPPTQNTLPPLPKHAFGISAAKTRTSAAAAPPPDAPKKDSVTHQWRKPAPLQLQNSSKGALDEPVHQSPTDAFMNVAYPTATAVKVTPPKHRYSDAASHRPVPLWSPITNSPGSGRDQGGDEWPNKRARSENAVEVDQAGGHAARPATSYQNSYAGVQQVQHPTAGVPGQHENPATVDRLLAAQLLLNFSLTSRTLKKAPSERGTSSQVPGAAPLGAPVKSEHKELAVKQQEITQPIQQAGAAGFGIAEASGSVGAQTRTPPEEAVPAPEPVDAKTVRQRQGTGTRGSRGRGRGSGARRADRRLSKPKDVNSGAPGAKIIPDQLHSPQSLSADSCDAKTNLRRRSLREVSERFAEARTEMNNRARCRSQSNVRKPVFNSGEDATLRRRSKSIPRDFVVESRSGPGAQHRPSRGRRARAKEKTVCSSCGQTDETSQWEDAEWVECDGCDSWFHVTCVGFKSRREVRLVNKFYCDKCKATHGESTRVRTSARNHVEVDYAGLNEGVIRIPDETYGHHYIKDIKEGSFEFDDEIFPRVHPSLITAENLERSDMFTQPIVIPAHMNPRPAYPPRGNWEEPDEGDSVANAEDDVAQQYECEIVADDGQDRLDMVIPNGLTVRRVANIHGPDHVIDVIDVKSQDSSSKMTLQRWADYYEDDSQKPIRNVISLEFSHSTLGRLMRRPKVVRDLDLQDNVWPKDEVAKGSKVQFYCLMSIKDSYTDFHIDFGGSSVYYHIVKGKKTFLFIPPTTRNLAKYQEWNLSPDQNHTFLPNWTSACYRVDLSEGDTMLIPSGWIHAVWTPEDSLVIGGNFLTRLHYSLQLKVNEVEKATKVNRKFRYPAFQKVMWFAVLDYLEKDPLPAEVAQIFREGSVVFRERDLPYCFDEHGDNCPPGKRHYNARYYSKAELDGLPDLVKFIYRTVLISLGAIYSPARKAVTDSIPKGRGEPLEIAKTFAMWASWKRGNECMPEWAHPNYIIVEDAKKEIGPAAQRKAEKKALADAARPTPDRQSARQRMKAEEAARAMSPPATPSEGQNGKYISTPKTSQLGPKRIACDACRKRRIRCKHKDQLFTGSSQMVAVVIPSPKRINGVSPEQLPSTQQTVQAPSKSDASVTPNGTLYADGLGDTPDGKRGRTKACLECRKSKRRCIHDEYGNIDPVKQQESPVPRGSAAHKKRRSSTDMAVGANKRPKIEPYSDDACPDGMGEVFMDDIGPEGDYYSSSIADVQDISMDDAAILHREDHFPVEDVTPNEDVTFNEDEAQPERQHLVQSIEDPEEALETVDLIGQSEVPEDYLCSKEKANVQPQTPVSPIAIAQSAQHPGSPLLDMSPTSPRITNGGFAEPDSAQSVRHSSRQSKPIERYSATNQEASGSKARRLSSNTSRSVNDSKSMSPSVVVKKSGQQAQKSARRDSHSIPKPEEKSTGLQTETNDEASQKLIRELLGRDRGLRRVG